MPMLLAASLTAIQFIKSLLKRVGKNQTWLAEQLDVSSPTVTDYLKNPTWSTLEKIYWTLTEEGPVPELAPLFKEKPVSSIQNQAGDRLSVQQQESLQWALNAGYFDAILEFCMLFEELPPSARDRLVAGLSLMQLKDPESTPNGDPEPAENAQ